MNSLTTTPETPKHDFSMTSKNDFGSRLAELRKSLGLTQSQLGDAIGVSKRVIAYYETDGGQPPGAMLPNLAKALDVSVEQLLGVKTIKKKESPKVARLLNRLRKVEQLSVADQRSVLKYIDSLYDQQKRTRKKAAK